MTGADADRVFVLFCFFLIWFCVSPVLVLEPLCRGSGGGGKLGAEPPSNIVLKEKEHSQELIKRSRC